MVVSYGLGLDSTCLLLRWLTEPQTRDFDLADMVVVTAMTGDEFASTARDVETFIWGQILMFTVVPAEASWPGLA
ncbi:hypothetical protein BTO20_36705 (plasmid) [Mycobacterium dioxanotrophicus]|uniref:Uncharacterized protein n=1 Tax=Mycobacterium dioxanotrophicus TaxID=482462 RepID=A0A1Y0CGB8_9MYCO|nr:hypothetical protein BTO20_36705 [Mycobacterium dioxanotrophicus]